MKNYTENIIRPLNLSTDRTNTFKHIHETNRKRDYVIIGNQRKVLKFIKKFLKIIMIIGYFIF